MNITPLFLLDIELDSGTQHVAGKEVNAPSTTYEPFVVSWGVFESAVPSPVGLPIVGDAKFKLAESEARRFRDLFSNETPRRRKCKLWTLFEGESLLYRQPDTSPPELRTPFFTGEIVNAVFNADRSIDFVCRDTTYAWIDEQIPAMVIKEIYPGLPERYEGQFLNIVVGEVRTPISTASPPPTVNKYGQIPLPRMGWNDETGDRWGVAMHPCARIVVYRKVEVNISNPEEWEHVSAGEYEERIIPVTAFNLEMNHHVIDFFVEQEDGTELRADIDGIYYRGPLGSLPEVGTPLGSPPQGTTSPPADALLNPIDFYIGMMYLIMNKAGVSVENVFDIDDITALRTKFETLGLRCDGAITQPITCREWLGQFLTDFNLDQWQKRNGKISLNYTDEEDPNRPVYTETDLILKNTFTEYTPEKPINQFHYRYQYNFAEGTFGTWGILDTSEQEILAIGLEPKVEKEISDHYFIRDAATALAIITHRSQFLSLGSYTQEWEIPLPEVPISLEPTSLVGITHRMGLQIGGYVNREAKVLKLRHDFDKLKTQVTSILRVPQIFAGTFYGDSIFDIVTRPQQSNDTSSKTWNSTILQFDPDWFTGGIIEFIIEVEAVNAHATLPYNIYLEDMDSSEIAHTFTIPANQTLFTLQQEAFTPLSGVRLYRMKMDQTAADNQLRAQNMRIRVRCEGVQTAVFMYPFMHMGHAINQNDLVVGDSRFTLGTSSGILEESNAGIFFKETDAWDTVDHWSLHVVAGNTGFTGLNETNVYFARSDGALIAGTTHEIESSNTEYMTVDFAHDHSNFTDGDEFTIFSEQNNTSANNTLILRTSIYVHMSAFNKANVFYAVDQTRLNIRESATPSENLAGVFFEVTGEEDVAGTRGTKLAYITSPVFGGSETTVSGSEINPTSSTKTRYRSSELTMPAGDGNYFDSELLSGTGTVDLCAEFVIMKITGGLE